MRPLRVPRNSRSVPGRKAVRSLGFLGLCASVAAERKGVYKPAMSRKTKVLFFIVLAAAALGMYAATLLKYG